MKTCPKCYKISVDNAMWCDCGYKWHKAIKEQECEYGWHKAKKEQESTIDKVNNDYELEIINLKKSIDDLREKGKKAIASRDKWKKRAELAESKLEESNDMNNNNNKFKKVKISFLKMYHPDSVSGDRFEKLIKQEIFKEFWQSIEDIERDIA